MNILVTGGAGFIGSHLADKLVEENHTVFIYDSLEPQVHKKRPGYLNKDVELIEANVCSRNILKDTIQNKKIDVIFHLAATVGVGQSMYDIRKYYKSNVCGTATLLDVLANEDHTVKKLIVASSMSAYGEGLYLCGNCGLIKSSIRSQEQLDKHRWECYCDTCGRKLVPIPTPESREQICTSFYARTKKEQEKMCLLFGENYDVGVTALRFFNVYGSRQALSNPYTGVCAIFATSLLCGNSPIVFEDGKQTRDFVHVNDICQALMLVMNTDKSNGEVYNVGSGKSITILTIAETLRDYINPAIEIKITNEFRAGDIRHCVADISKLKKLGYRPHYRFKEGITEFVDWVKTQEDVEDKIKQAKQEFKSKIQ